jgi:endo-1,4-beta-xylanase
MERNRKILKVLPLGPFSPALRSLRSPFFLAAVLLAFVGCGGDDDGRSSPMPTATATAIPIATTTPTRTVTATAASSQIPSPTVTRIPTSSATSTATETPPETPPSDTATATATETPTASPTATPTDDATLAELADRAGVFVGASFVEGSQEEEFRTVLVREFNSTTAPVYWSATEPHPNQFDFTASDAAVDIAEANGLRLRGHPLVWGRLALPDYVNQRSDAEELRALMANHIRTIVGRYRGRIKQYDVVNEPITLLGAPGMLGDGLENYVFLRVLGPGYIREALDIAHEADPDAELYINDFFLMQPGPKQDYFFELIRGLVEDGAPLNGVGFQGHITPPFGPQYLPTREQIAAAVRRFTALGLDVEITELDVTLEDPVNDLAEQGRIYGDVYAGCFFTPGCRGITIWGITDKYTWIRNTFHVEGAPLMFDESYRPKPAYFAARAVLQELNSPAE